jgi:hypothetical protein
MCERFAAEMGANSNLSPLRICIVRQSGHLVTRYGFLSADGCGNGPLWSSTWLRSSMSNQAPH